MHGSYGNTGLKTLDEIISEVVTTSFGHQMGPIIGMDSFPINEFTLAELLLMDYDDRQMKRIQKGRSRKMGGPDDEHSKDLILVDLEINRRLEQRYGLRLKGEVYFSSDIRHDYGENDEVIDRLRRELKVLRSNGTAADSARVHDIVSRIKARREAIITSAYEGRMNFIRLLHSSGIADDNERGILERRCAVTMGVVDWAARHVEDREYYQSAHHLFRMHTAREYIKYGRGGPFQKKVMDVLQIGPDDPEPTNYFAIRLYLRLRDRTALSRERKPRFTEEQAKELDGILQGNHELMDTYGAVNFRAERKRGFSRPYVLRLLYRNSVVLHNVGEALNKYGQKISEERDDNDKTRDAFDYLLKIAEERELLVKESIGMIMGLKRSYERSLRRKGIDVKELQKRVDEIERTDPKQVEVITEDGPITSGVGYDALPGRELNRLDRYLEGRIQNYIDVLINEKLFSKFADQQRNVVDPYAGIFSLFTIEGLTDRLTKIKEPLKF